MSDTTPLAEMRDRSNSKKKRFGLFNLFGFGSGTDTANPGAAGLLDNCQDSINSNVAPACCDHGNPADISAVDTKTIVSDSHGAEFTALKECPNVTDLDKRAHQVLYRDSGPESHRGMPEFRPISISRGPAMTSNQEKIDDKYNSRFHQLDSFNHGEYGKSVALATLGSGENNGSDGSMSRLHSSPLPSALPDNDHNLHRRLTSLSVDKINNGTSTFASTIRTCPIPERLQLHTGDIQGYYIESSPSGPVASSTNTLAGSPQAFFDHRVSRHATMSSGTGGTLDKTHSKPLYVAETHSPRKGSLPSGTSSRHEGQHPFRTLSSIASGSAAQHTSSNNSSWSMATPTSTNDMAEVSPAITSISYSGYDIHAQDWETAGTDQQQIYAPITPSSLRPRTKGRRYSVFDASFANLSKGEANTSNHSHKLSAPISIPQNSPTSSRRINRRTSRKSFIGAAASTTCEQSPLFESVPDPSRGLRPYLQTSKSFLQSNGCRDTSTNIDVRAHENASLNERSGSTASAGITNTMPNHWFPTYLEGSGQSRAASSAIATLYHSAEYPYNNAKPEDERIYGLSNQYCDISLLRSTISMSDIRLMAVFAYSDEWLEFKPCPGYYYQQVVDISRNLKTAIRQQRLVDAGDKMKLQPWSSVVDRFCDMTGKVSKIQRQESNDSIYRPQNNTAKVTSVPFPILENTHSPMNCDNDGSTQNMHWHRWFDGLYRRPVTRVTAQAVSMWQSILSDWKRRHSSESDIPGHQSSSHAGYTGNSIVHSTSKHAADSSFGNSRVGDGEDIGAALPWSGDSLAFTTPYLMEPTYFQRGSSESGRSGANINPSVPFWLVNDHSQTDSVNHPGIIPEGPVAGRAKTPGLYQMWDHTPESASNEKRTIFSLPISGLETYSLYSAADEDRQVLQPAPHRRLSVIKHQELGTRRTLSRASSGGSLGSNVTAGVRVSRSTVGSSAVHSKSTGMASADDTGNHVFSRAAQEQPIIIAQLEAPDQAVSSLFAFYMRLRQRIERVKFKSDNELLCIIQDLGGFVEERLCYFNEDTDTSDSESVYEAVNCTPATIEKNGPHLFDGDDDGTHTPGLLIAKTSLPDEQRMIYSRHKHHGGNACLPSPGLEERVNSRFSIRYDLESLNDRLHSMLNHHGNSDKSGPDKSFSSVSGSSDGQNNIVTQSESKGSEQPRHSRDSTSPPLLRGLEAFKTVMCEPDKSLVHEAYRTPFHKDKQEYSTSQSNITERSLSQAPTHSTGSRASLSASPLVEEDRFKPTPFIEATMDLVKVIGCVINLSADDMLHPISGQLLDDALMESSNVADMSFSFEKKREHILSIMPTEYLIEKLDALGAKWEQSWPCRGLFFRALLAISSLNRIVKWYSVVRSTFNEDIIGRLDKQTHIDSSAGGLPESIVLPNDISPSVDTEPSNPLGTSHSSKIPKDFTHSTVSDSTTAEKANLSNNVGLCHDRLSHRPKDMATSSATALKACSTSHPTEQSVDKRLALDTAVFDKSFNMLLEVSLDGRIRYISPTCRQLLGASPESIVDLPAAAIFEVEDIQLCHSAVEQLLADSTRTVEINIKVHAPRSSSLVDVEAKGMLIYSRSKRLPSHILWVLRYVPSNTSMHSLQTGSIGDSQDDNIPRFLSDDVSLQTLEPITCRICDISVPAAYFEEHTWLCAKSHRAAMHVCQQNDRLSDLKAEIQAWYPGCSSGELEAFIHGAIEVRLFHEKSALRATEIGHVVWQKRMDQAAAAMKSMMEVCSLAIAVDEKDAVPKCELPALVEKDGIAFSQGNMDNSKSRDFVRSHLWTKVASYKTSTLDCKEVALADIQALLVDAIKVKLDAIDALQYAIVDSSVALSRWMPSDDPHVDLDVYSDSKKVAVSDAVELGGGQSYTKGKSSGICSDSIPDSEFTSDLGGNIGSHQMPSTETLHIQSRQLDAEHSEPIIPPIVPLKTSHMPDHVSNPSQLRISTKDLSITPSRSRARSNTSSNTFLATPMMPSINDFTLLKPISKGAYGSVYLAKKRTTGEYYAIKVLRKADMIAKNQISNVKAERAIMMAQTGSPFVVRLLYTFQSRTNLYLVMEYLNGGDCASLLKSIGTLPEDWARQYLAEVVLGIQDLHARDVVHRDLKPDNLLIDSEGHLKLTDFGLSKLGFLGRRVDQQAVDNMPRADQTQACCSHDHKTQSMFIDGNIQNLNRPLPSEIPYSIYSQGAARNDRVHRSESTAKNISYTMPLITTPPAIKSDTCHHSSVHNIPDGLQRYQTDSTFVNSSPLNKDKDLSKRRVSLEPTSDQFLSLSDRDEGCAAPSNSSSASLGSIGFGAMPSSNQHKHALGTPDYIAPESILGLEAGKSVDWWALGIICYEFIFGVPPFNDETPEKVFKNILSSDIDFYDDLREQPETQKRQWQDTMVNGEIHDQSSIGSNKYDDTESDIPYVSPEARDFIKRLLCRDPKKRLGYNGAEELKKHPIFRDIDWSTILETQASFIPKIESMEDTDYFDSRGATMDAHESTDYIEGEPDKYRLTSRSCDFDGADSHIQYNYVCDEPRSWLDSSADSQCCTSNQVSSSLSSHGRKVPLCRSKTLPSMLGDCNRSEDTSSNGLQDMSVKTPESDAVKDIGYHGEQKYRQCSPLVDETPDSEFGVFTFKNLHALEQANMNELVKVRRRSTMLDISATSGISPYGRTSSSYVPSFPTRSSSFSRGVQQYSYTEVPNISNSISSNSNSAIRPYQTSPVRKHLSTQALYNTDRVKNHPDLYSGLSFVSEAPPIQHSHVSRGSLLNPDVRLHPQSGIARSIDCSIGTDQPLLTTEPSLEITNQCYPPAEPASMQSSVCLVADDNPVCCKVMEVMLKRLHLQCVIVRNGAEALRCAMGRTAFRAIFMDTGMPIVDGDEATRMIKSTYNINKDTPVIAMAAYAGETVESLYDGTIVKPTTLYHVKKSLGYMD